MTDDYPTDPSALLEKCQSLEAECHSLLSRAIQSEQKLADITTERDSLKQSNYDVSAKASKATSRADAEQQRADELQTMVDKLNDQLGNDRDLFTQLETEKINAKRHNELRLKVEQNFADLSLQYETLHCEHEDLQDRLTKTQGEFAICRDDLAQVKEQLAAMERAVAQTSEERDQHALRADEYTDKYLEEKREHDHCKVDLTRAQNSLKDLRQEVEEAHEAEDRAKREMEALRKKANVWKRQAEAARDLELRNESLLAQHAINQKEIQSLKQVIKNLEAEIQRLLEEDRRKSAEAISPKTYQFLKDQLAEMTQKYRNLHEKERGWLKDRNELTVQIAKLKKALQTKNPSQLRLMEMEVQNQLLLGMIQNSNSPLPPKRGTKSGAFGAGSKSPGATAAPPKHLPPLEHVASGATSRSGNSPTKTISPSRSEQPTSATRSRHEEVEVERQERGETPPVVTSTKPDELSSGPRGTSRPHSSASNQSVKPATEQQKDRSSRPPSSAGRQTPRSSVEDAAVRKADSEPKDDEIPPESRPGSASCASVSQGNEEDHEPPGSGRGSSTSAA